MTVTFKPAKLFFANNTRKTTQSNGKHNIVYWVAGWLVIQVTLLQGLWYPQMPFFSGAYIPDSITLWEKIARILNTTNFWQTLFSERTVGTLLLYMPVVWMSPKLMFLVNIILTLILVWIIPKAFHPLKGKAIELSLWCTILNPYLLLGASGPTKELPLTLITLLFVIRRPNWKHWHYHFLVLWATYLVRDGYAFLLIAWYVTHLVVHGRLLFWARIFLVLTPLMVLISYNWTGSLSSNIVSLVNRAEIVEYKTGRGDGSEIGAEAIAASLASLSNPVKSSQMFVYRMLGNAYSRPIRPVFTVESGRISLLGIAYYIVGIMLALGTTGALLTLVQNIHTDNERAYFAWLYLYLWAGISFTLFVHMRYMMPILPIGLALFGSLTRDGRLKISLVLLAVIALGLFYLYIVMGVPGLVSSDYGELPAFFFGS